MATVQKKGFTGVKYSQPGSLTGGGKTTSTGTSSGASVSSSRGSSESRPTGGSYSTESSTQQSSGITNELSKDSGPLSATAPFGMGPSSRAGQQYARELASSGQANFQSSSGRQQQVSYSGGGRSSNPSVPRAGITETLAASGVLGGQNSFARASYNPIETRTNINQDTARFVNGSVSRSTGGGRNGSVVGGVSQEFSGVESPRYRAVERTSAFVTRYQDASDQRLRTVDRQLSKLSFGRGTPFEQRSTFGKIGQTTAGIVTIPFYGPAVFADRSILAAQKSFLYTGALMTPETRSAARRELRETVPVIRRTLTDPYVVAPAIATGGILGYSQMRGAYTPRSVSVGSSRGMVVDASLSPNAISGVASGKAVGVAQYRYGPFNVFGRTEKVPVTTNVIFQGQRVPQTNYFGVMAESVSSVPTRGGLRFSQADFGGIYNARTNVLSLRSSSGELYFSQSGRSAPAYFDTVSSVDQSPGRFIELEQNRAGFPRVTATGRTGQLAETVDITRVPYQGNRFVGAFGRPSTRTSVESQSMVRSRAAGGANPDLFRGGFQNLERAGLYRGPEIVQRQPLGEIVASEARAFASNRRGSIGGGSRAQTVLEPSVLPRETVLRFPGRFELGGLPRGRFPTYTGGRLPFVIPIGGTRGILDSGSFSAGRPDTAPRTVTSSLTDVIPGPRAPYSPRLITVPSQITDADVLTKPFPMTPGGPGNRGGFRPPEIPPPRLTPPIAGGLPLFAPPGKGRGGGGSGTVKYRYAPSLVAGALNIRGPKQRGFLNPVSVRPIVEERRRRRKR